MFGKWDRWNSDFRCRGSRVDSTKNAIVDNAISMGTIPGHFLDVSHFFGAPRGKGASICVEKTQNHHQRIPKYRLIWASIKKTIDVVVVDSDDDGSETEKSNEHGIIVTTTLLLLVLVVLVLVDVIIIIIHLGSSSRND